MMEYIVGALLLIIVYQQIAHRQFVGKLLDRIMAKDLPELKAVTDGVEVKEPKSMSDRKEYEINCKKKGIIPQPEIK